MESELFRLVGKKVEVPTARHWNPYHGPKTYAFDDFLYSYSNLLFKARKHFNIFYFQCFFILSKLPLIIWYFMKSFSWKSLVVVWIIMHHYLILYILYFYSIDERRGVTKKKLAVAHAGRQFQSSAKCRWNGSLPALAHNVLLNLKVFDINSFK